MYQWIGAIFEGVGAIAQGVMVEEEADIESALMRRRGREIKATKARQSDAASRQGREVIGSIKTQHAASGGAMDAAMVERLARVQGRVDYNTASLQYEGEVGRKNKYYEAELREQRGTMEQFGVAVEGVSSIFGAMGGGGMGG